MDRDVRVLQQSKQKATLTKAVSHVNPKDLTEGIPKTVYIKGSGIYNVVKYNNQVFYSFKYLTSKNSVDEGLILPGGVPGEIPGEGADPTAIHDNVSGEINAITEKGTPVDADLVICEDSEDSYSKKKVQMSNLLGGGGGAEGVLLATTYDESATTGILIGAQYDVGA